MEKRLFITLCIFLLISVNNNDAKLKTINGKIKITIGTTSGCFDTVKFIQNQLGEAYPLYKDYLEVEFVPWGRTQRNADGSLTCQFGEKGCFANRVQRCALDMLKDDQDAQVQYMICEFTSPRPAYMDGSYACAHAAGLGLIDMDYCVTNTGCSLDVAAEEAAWLPMSIINFVPSIHFNDVINLNLHTEARIRLSYLICRALAADVSNSVTYCKNLF